MSLKTYELLEHCKNISKQKKLVEHNFVWWPANDIGCEQVNLSRLLISPDIGYMLFPCQ